MSTNSLVIAIGASVISFSLICLLIVRIYRCYRKREKQRQINQPFNWNRTLPIPGMDFHHQEMQNRREYPHVLTCDNCRHTFEVSHPPLQPMSRLQPPAYGASLRSQQSELKISTEPYY